MWKHSSPRLRSGSQRLVDCCFTSTETVGLLGTGAQHSGLSHSSWALLPTVGWVLLYVHRNRRLIRDGSQGRPPGLSHSFWALQPTVKVEVLLYVHRNRRFIRDGSPGRSPRLSHSSWAPQPTEGEQHLYSVGDLTTTTLYSVLHNNETPTLKGGESERRQLIQELGLFRCRKGRHFADHTHAHTRKIFLDFFMVPGEAGAFIAHTRGYSLSSHGTHRHSLVLGRWSRTLHVRLSSP